MTDSMSKLSEERVDPWELKPLNHEEFCLADAGQQWTVRQAGTYGIALYFPDAVMFMSASGDSVVFVEPGACCRKYMRPAYLRVAA